MSEFYSQKKKKKDGTEYIYYIPYCKECTVKKSMDWQKDNQEQYKKRLHYYIKNKEWRIKQDRENSKRRRENGKQLEWQRNNKDKVNKHNINRKLHKKHDITDEEWENCKNYFNYRCAYCGLPIEEHWIRYKGQLKLSDFHREHVDHNGSNDLSNCIPACKECNSSKHDKVLEYWYKPNNELWCTVYSYERLQKIYKWLNEDYK